MADRTSFFSDRRTIGSLLVALLLVAAIAWIWKDPPLNGEAGLLIEAAEIALEAEDSTGYFIVASDTVRILEAASDPAALRTTYHLNDVPQIGDDNLQLLSCFHGVCQLQNVAANRFDSQLIFNDHLFYRGDTVQVRLTQGVSSVWLSVSKF